MLAAIDIHKAVFQTAVLNPDDGEVLAEERFKTSQEEFVAWIEKWDAKLDVVAIEATTGWRLVTRELQAPRNRGPAPPIPARPAPCRATASDPRRTASTRDGS